MRSRRSGSLVPVIAEQSGDRGWLALARHCGFRRAGLASRAMPAPRVICFDLGGVLVRICRSWAEACEKAGVPVVARDWLAGEQAIAARSVVMRAYQNGELSTDAYYQGMLGALERHYTLDEIASIHDA